MVGTDCHRPKPQTAGIEDPLKKDLTDQGMIGDRQSELAHTYVGEASLNQPLGTLRLET
jgi:hypothetical protein